MLKAQTYLGGLLFGVFIYVAVSSHEAVAAQDCILSVGYNPSVPLYAPDETGTVVGIDANILRATAAELGCSLDFAVVPWTRTLIMIENGQLDVTMSASFKPERAKFAHYSVPYRGHPHFIYVQKQRKLKAHNLVDFLNLGHSVGVVNGWHYTYRVQNLMKSPRYKAQFVVVPGLENAVSMLDANRFDGFIANPAEVRSIAGEHKFNYSYDMIEADKDDVHFIFSKKTVSQDFIEQFNKVLQLRLRGGLFNKVCSEFKEHLVAKCSDLHAGLPLG